MKPSRVRILLLALAILGISLVHYVTPLHLHYLHDVFQRLYYLPIIFAALWFGLRGGLVCSLVVSIVYAPHILFQWGGTLTVEMEKYLEILLYNVVGAVTGLLAQREQERAEELRKTAQGLEHSYRKLEEQSERIIAIEEQLRRAERLSTLGEMAAVLAHEVRNPLASLRGSAEILRDDYRPGDAKYEFLDMQIRETERLNRVVEEFLRMARSRPTDLKPCRLREELETIITLTVGEARKRQVALALLPGGDSATVLADGDKLRQAFLNVVINALQATPPGGNVTIAIADNGREVCFSDTGPGIPPEALERIFEPFFTTKQDGTGLGLAVTRKIIEAHGGTLAVESEAGQGTTVVVRLPEPEEVA
ncbi:two-component system sensor histidine kinase NtrB [Trichlorobacter ammonificans]|uniref:histidine kinase n=1 Tax=Trichlorobacter ammonificans TaxID=2916410 RepID=A0ABN8HGN1_9BACT|nr:ATP-binding protein [Trichlorobacter ammonificans]CAH2030393.1 Histidine kinase [Trichlorobacter ammonificans]